MDNEQILLTLYKQQQYDQTRSKLQKLFMLVSTAASFIGLIVESFYFSNLGYVIVSVGFILCVSINALLLWRNKINLNTASFATILYAGFAFIPAFWFVTGLIGSASLVSLIILVSMITLLSEKQLHWVLSAYLLVLVLLTLYSALTGFRQTEPVHNLVYYITAYAVTVAAIVMYMLSKQKAFNELNDKFLRSSFKDELTQLYNRKLLDLILEYQESLYVKEQKDYILIMFDIDDFKALNDKHGHMFGDIILRSVAACIKDTTRKSDFVVRYGGDEFLVIQTNASQSSVQTFLNRIEEKMESSCQLEIDVAVSFGFAMRSECKQFEAVLQLADERLYQQKGEKKSETNPGSSSGNQSV